MHYRWEDGKLVYWSEAPENVRYWREYVFPEPDPSFYPDATIMTKEAQVVFWEAHEWALDGWSFAIVWTRTDQPWDNRAIREALSLTRSWRW